MSLIDLLAEEVDTNNLDVLVNELITETLSFYQSNQNEKETLTNIFGIRVNKLKPIVQGGDFPILKNSGTNIRLYEEIIAHFDFEDEIWEQEFQPLDKKWLRYILDNGVFQLNRFIVALKTFNEENKCNVSSDDVKKAIVFWMNGEWYRSLSEKLQLETHQILRMMNFFIGFNLQSMISSVIRLRELKKPFYLLPAQVTNWASFLTHGINSQLQLDLIELGLIDRVAVLEVSKYLSAIGYVHEDYNSLKAYLLLNGVEITEAIRQNLPVISINKLNSFINRLQIRNIL